MKLSSASSSLVNKNRCSGKTHADIPEFMSNEYNGVITWTQHYHINIRCIFECFRR